VGQHKRHCAPSNRDQGAGDWPNRAVQRSLGRISGGCQGVVRGLEDVAHALPLSKSKCKGCADGTRLESGGCPRGGGHGSRMRASMGTERVVEVLIRRTKVRTPRTSGIVERINRTLLTRLSHAARSRQHLRYVLRRNRPTPLGAFAARHAA